METRIKIRNVRQRKWRRLLAISGAGFILMFILAMFVVMNALSPERLSDEGQYCEVNVDWMSWPFAVYSWDNEDIYDFYLVNGGDRFMIVSTWVDNEDFMDYLDLLYADDTYTPVEKQLSGASVSMSDDLKNLALEELSYDLGQTLTMADFDDYIYPYVLDTTSGGDLDTLYVIMMLLLMVFIVAVVGSVISGIRHALRMGRLKSEPFYERMVRKWSDSGQRMDTARRPMVVLPGYLIVPEYEKLVLPLEQVAWCYAVPQGRRRDTVYVMDMNGRLSRLCQLRRRRGSEPYTAEDYMAEIHLCAPWCRIGYTAENRQDFGGLNRKMTLDKIIFEKDKYLSQIPLNNGYY